VPAAGGPNLAPVQPVARSPGRDCLRPRRPRGARGITAAARAASARAAGSAQEAAAGRLLLDYGRPGLSGTWHLDPESLKPLGPAPAARLRRAAPGGVTSTFPGMQVRTASDSGSVEANGSRYLLRWESLGPTRDRPREPLFPEPVMLKLPRLEAPAAP